MVTILAGPLPRFDGMAVDPPQSPRDTGTTSPPPGAPIRVPPLNPDDVNKFTSLFEKSDIRGGVLSGMLLYCLVAQPRHDFNDIV